MGKVLRWLTKKPILNGGLAALATAPYSLSLFQDQWMPGANYWDQIKWGLPLITAFGLISASSVAIQSFVREKEPTKLKHYKIRKKLEERLKDVVPPKLPKTGETEVSYNVGTLYSNIFHPDTNKVLEKARKTKNPLTAIDTITRQFEQSKFDEGVLLLRDALDWLGHQRPRLSAASRLQYMCQNIALKLSRQLNPGRMESYLLTAIYTAIMEPEKSWYWSSLGTMMAEEMNHPKKKEMHVLHALMATAQQRSDQEEAWAEVYDQIRKSCRMERIGESRHPVWKLKSEEGELLSGTFVFKGNQNRAELEDEWKATLKLEQILGDKAVAPQPLYIAEPFDRAYIYIMRQISGELLSDQIMRGDYSGLEKVVPVMGRISARYPTNGMPKVSIREKTCKKFKELGLEGHPAIKYFEPVIKDLEAQPVWAVNKDGHPEQWELLDDQYSPAEVGVLDAEMRDTHPIVNEAANLLYCMGKLPRRERNRYTLRLAKHLRDEGAAISKPALSQAYKGEDRLLIRGRDNAAIHRALCFVGAWSAPDRPKMHGKRGEQCKKAIMAIEELKTDDPDYHNSNKADYEGLKAFYTKLPELIPS